MTKLTTPIHKTRKQILVQLSNNIKKVTAFSTR